MCVEGKGKKRKVHVDGQVSERVGMQVSVSESRVVFD